MPPLSDEEKSNRIFSLGSSEISAVIGVNPYASCHGVWLNKMGISTFDGNEATELGNALEPAILGVYAKRYGRTLRDGYSVIGKEPWMSATPDAFIEGGGLAEAKLVGLRSIWQWGPGNSDSKESDAAPVAYLTQALWQMEITGEPFVDIAALLGTEFRSYRIRRNEELQANLVKMGRRFWERYVLTKTPPPVDGSDGAKEMLAKLYPRSGPERIQATQELNALAEELREARETVAAAETAKTFAENKMKSAVGNASGVVANNWALRWANSKSGSRPFVFTHELEKSRKGQAA